MPAQRNVKIKKNPERTNTPKIGKKQENKNILKTKSIRTETRLKIDCKWNEKKKEHF